jgi:hypothetical protein
VSALADALNAKLDEDAASALDMADRDGRWPRFIANRSLGEIEAKRARVAAWEAGERGPDLEFEIHTMVIGYGISEAL